MKCKAITNAIRKWTSMSKAILILCLCSAYTVSCEGNEKPIDDHQHEHGDHEHDHGDHDHDDHDHHHDHDQETFTVEDDSLANE